MKKIFSLLLVAMLLTVFCCPVILAETADVPAAPVAPMVNLTGLFLAVVAMIFNMLLAWLLKAVIPPLKEWLKVHATAEQQSILWNITVRLVDAMEQTITGP